MDVEFSPLASPKISPKRKVLDDSSLQYFPNGMVYPPELPKNLKYRPKSEQLKVYADWAEKIAKSGFQTPQEPLVEEDSTKTKDAEKEQNRARLESMREDLLRQADRAGHILHDNAIKFGQSFVEEKHNELESIYNALSRTGLTEQELAFAEQRLRSLVALMEEKLKPKTAEKKKTPEDEVNEFMEQLREASKIKMEEEKKENEKRKRKGLLGKVIDKLPWAQEKKDKLYDDTSLLLKLVASYSITTLAAFMSRTPPFYSLVGGLALEAPWALMWAKAPFTRAAENLGRNIDIFDARHHHKVSRAIERFPKAAESTQNLTMRAIFHKAARQIVDATDALLHDPRYQGIAVGLLTYGLAGNLYEPHTAGIHDVQQGSGVYEKVVGSIEKAVEAVTTPPPPPPVSPEMVQPQILPDMMVQIRPGSDVWNSALELAREWVKTGIIPPNPDGHIVPVVNLLKNLSYGIEAPTKDGTVAMLNPDLAQEIVKRFLYTIDLAERQHQVLTGVDKLLYEIGRVGRHATWDNVITIINAFAGK